MRIDRQKLHAELNSQLGKISSQKIIDELNNKVNLARQETLEEFDNHPVTQEMAAGPASQSSQYVQSKTGGNLFSFFGFYPGENPERDLRKTLEKGIRKGTITKKMKPDGTIVYETTVNIPTLESLGSSAPLLEWTNLSWIESLEVGVSGFSNYLFKLVNRFKNSRSGTAIQIKKQLRPGRVLKVKYMSEILSNLRKRLS